MMRLTLRNLAANKVRLALTTFAVVLGVSFVVSSFVLSDGLRRTFGDLSEEIVAGTDLEVRPVSEFGVAPPLTDAALDEVRATPGVDVAAPLVESAENSVHPVKPDGTTIDSLGPPKLAFSWIDDEQLNPFTVVDGRAPVEPDEFVLDLDSAADHGFIIGERYAMVTPTGQRDMTLVGTTRFGEDNTTLGAVLIGMPMVTIQQAIGLEGYSTIQVSLDGTASSLPVLAEMQARLGDGAEVVDNATLADEQRAEFNEGIDLIGNVLLGFAVVSLFVSIFIITNTFAIVVGQRTRELGLLRALGADQRQVRRSVLGEALIVGLVASVTGIVGGVGVAAGLRALFEALGVGLPAAPVILAPRTIGVALALGVGVTLLAANAPARRAARVAPMAAMAPQDGVDRGGSRRRVLSGAALALGGVGIGGWALFGETPGTAALLALLGAGAVAVFVGVSLVSPVVAGPLARIVGWPLARLLGIPGSLARQNAARNPRRTATTAAALMIGLALVSMAMIVGESVKAQFRDVLDSTVQADYVVVTDEDVSSTLAVDLSELPELGAVTALRYDEARIGDDVVDTNGMDLAAGSELFDLGVRSGSLDGADPATSVLVHVDDADDRGLSVGDAVAVEFASGATRTLTVAGVYDESFVFGGWIIDLSVWEDVYPVIVDDWVAASIADGSTVAEAEAAIATVQSSYPQAEIQSNAEFRADITGQVDQVLAVLNALLALAVFIAFLGIANTLALSVHERTRELGLLRAVGMTRRQVRRMVRWEAAIVAIVGAVLGVSLGLGFGAAVVTALPDDITETLAIPTGRIVTLMVIAGGAGLGAALLPARRAGRLPVLDAISA